MKCCDNCKCSPKKIDVHLFIPEGLDIGEVKVFQIAKNGEPIGQLKAGRVEDDWDTDDDDPDYIPAIDSDDDPYEHADLTDADKKELRDELTDILMDMAQDELDEMNN